MGVVVFFYIILVSVVFMVVDVTKMDVCDVKRILEDSHILGNTSDWMCIICEDTGYEYDLVQNLTPVGLRYGLFQFQEPIWCESDGYNPIQSYRNRCKMHCYSFLDEDLSDDIRCAEDIYLEYGFMYWSIWVERCYNQDLDKIEYGALCGKNSNYY